MQDVFHNASELIVMDKSWKRWPASALCKKLVHFIDSTSQFCTNMVRNITGIVNPPFPSTRVTCVLMQGANKPVLRLSKGEAHWCVREGA